MTELLQHQIDALQQHLEQAPIPNSVDESLFQLDVAKTVSILIALAAMWEETK